MPKRYRKKPVVVQAVQWDGTAEGATSIIHWVERSAGNGAAVYLSSVGQMAIATLEGTMRASAGDWIVRGIKGEFYPCKPDIFADSYEEQGS